MVIFWGTFFPLISEFFTGEKHSLAAPWFNRYVTPIGVLLVLFTGIGPLLAWGRLSGGAARRLLLWPGIAARGDDRRPARGQRRREPSLGALRVRLRGLHARRACSASSGAPGSTRRALTGEPYPRALATAVGRNRRRYGGYIVHAGIALTLIGIAASSSFQTNRDLRLQVGQTAKVGDYTIAYRKLTADPRERADLVRAPSSTSRGTASRSPR